jgi:hypothetical protein
MEIGMSDVMDSYSPHQWGTDVSEPTRSVMAYQTLLMWKSLGLPLTVTTRLDTYKNMVIANIATPDDFRTLYGLKCVVSFKQIFTVSVAIKVSIRMPVTASANLGKKAIVVVPDDSSALKKVVKRVTGAK